MPKKPSISDKDLTIFQEAVAGTKPLKPQQRRARPKPPPSKPTVKRKPAETEEMALHEALDISPVRGEEFISYKQTGVSNKTLRKLRKGQYTIEALLDLHGLTVEEALLAVNDFLSQCLRDELSVVLIVHGKGRHSEAPVLKNKLNLWLRTTPAILAFCSAGAVHGNRGAVYVLLKKKKEEPVEWTKKVQL